MCGARHQPDAPAGFKSGQQEKGTALVSCALILFAVAMLVMGARQIVLDSAAAALNLIDRQLAYQSAEAALMEAKQMIVRASDDTVMQQARCHGQMAGNGLLQFAGGQIMPMSEIQITLHPLPAETESERHFYRATAKALGMKANTQVILQADFIKMPCDSATHCEKIAVRRIAWRILDGLPTEWLALDAVC